MAVPKDYFDMRVDKGGTRSNSTALNDAEALEVAIGNLRKLASALRERRDNVLGENWKPAQVQRVKDRYPDLRKAVIEAAKALPTP